MGDGPVRSLEFFSRLDPLYRTYGKQDALTVQRQLFEEQDGLRAEWLEYETSFRSLSHFVKFAADAFGVAIPGGKTQAGGVGCDPRTPQRAVHPCRHPFRHQGSGKLYTYKLFLELAHAVASVEGRIGMLVPSGVYTDKGTTELRKLFLGSCRWEWLYGFENRTQIFPIDSRFKFAPIVIERGG